MNASRYFIENDDLRAEFLEKGGQWCRFVNKHTGDEYLWEGDPQVWSGHAPVLFPVIGVQHNGHIRIGKDIYPHPKHGFFRDMIPEVTQKSPAEIEFSVKASPETRKMYPYEFEFSAAFSLNGYLLENSFHIRNTGNEEMFFNLGAHPAFRICNIPNETLSDVFLRFEADDELESHRVHTTGLLLPDTFRIPLHNRCLHLSDTIFDEDALVLKGLKSRTVWLESEKHSRRIKVDFPQFPYLGIWAKPGAKYVCIEPWIGCADTFGEDIDFREKEQIQRLEPGEELTLRISVEVLHPFS